MEGNFNFKNNKPTLSTPSKQGKQLDTYFKKQMKPTGMSIKENAPMINEKEESLKKKIFKLDKMETLVHTDENLSKIFNEMKEDAAEKFGYHWNETILNMIFNDYVLNSPKYLHKYKVTRAKAKTRRGEEGIAQLQNDIDKEKEASSNAEDRKNDLMSSVDSKPKTDSEEKLDEWNPFKSASTPAPAAPTSKDDTYFVDMAKKKLLGVVPAKASAEERQRIMTPLLGNPNVKQLAWLAAFDLGVQGVPNAVSDGSTIDQVKQQMNAKYKSAGGYQGIPSMAEQVVDETTGSASSGAFAMGLDAQGKQSKEIADQTYQNETTTSSSSGQYSGKAIWSKNGTPAANKPAWKGGKIIGESVVNSDFDYLTNAEAFKKYITKAEVLQILNEDFMPEGAETFQQHAQRMLGKLNQYAIEDPILKNDADYQNMIKIWSERAKTGQAAPPTAPQQQPAQPAANAAPVVPQADNTKQWQQQPAPMTEHHLHSREEKIDFILQNGSGNHDAQSLSGLDDAAIDALYGETEQSIGMDEAALAEMEKENPMYEANNFIKSMVKDLKNTGRPADENESADELESKDGLFKGKWNDNKESISESANLSADNLAKWAVQNATSPESIQQFADENGISLETLKQKAKFYASNSALFPNGNAIKDAMLDLLSQLQGISEAMGGDPEAGEDQYKEEQDANEYIALENQMKELAALNASGNVQELKSKIDAMPIIPIANHAGGNGDFGHRDLEKLGYVKCAYKAQFSDDDHELIVKNISNKPVAQLDNYRHTYNLIQPGELSESVKKNKFISEGIFGNDVQELGIEQIAQAVDNFKQSPESQELREKFVKAKDYVKQKAGNIMRMPQLKMWLDQNMPQLSNYVSTLWGNWDLVPSDKLTETKDKMKIDKDQYKELIKAKLKSSGKSLKEMADIDKKNFFNEASGEYKQIKESMIDDQPDSIINNQETSIAKTMDSDELNKDATSAASVAPIGGVEEGYDSDDMGAKGSVLDKYTDYSDDEPNEEPISGEVDTEIPAKSHAPQYYNQGKEDAEIAQDADKFRQALKAKYGVDSVSDLSHVERQELMNSMNFGAKEKQAAPTMDMDAYVKDDAQKAEYLRNNDPSEMLDYLNKNVGALKTPNDFRTAASAFKAATGKIMQHPMSIYGAIQKMSPEERSKFAGLENYFKSNVKGGMKEESINEDRKTSSVLNVEKLGNENAKNFKQDTAQEDGVSDDTNYPFKKSGIYTDKVWPDPAKFYIEQDPKKFQTAKSMADLEREALAKSKGSLENIGDATADGKNIPKRNLTKEEMYALAMNRGDGMQDIVYDNKPSEKFEKRMEADMGDDVYKARQDKMDYKADAPMYNKDTQPTENGDKKLQDNKFEKGYNNESIVAAKYSDEYGKIKLVEFKMMDVQELTSIDENAFKLSMDGMGNKYALVGKKINENVGYESITAKYDFYLHENNVYAVAKKAEVKSEKKQVVNESKFNKMKHLMNYKPNNYVDPSKSVKF